MAVSVSTAHGVTLGQPQRLFDSTGLSYSVAAPNYDVSADGLRFITTAPDQDGDADVAPPKIRIVKNWYEEFRDRER